MKSKCDLPPLFHVQTQSAKTVLSSTALPYLPTAIDMVIGPTRGGAAPRRRRRRRRRRRAAGKEWRRTLGAKRRLKELGTKLVERHRWL